MAIELLDDKRENFLRVVVAAAGRGDLEAVQELLDYNPAWIHEVGSHGRTMLWEAAYRGKLNVVKFLAERGADINAVGCHFSTHLVEVSPYCAAKSKGREEVADYLLVKGAKIEIHSAAYLGYYEQVLTFLNENPSLVNQEHAYTQRYQDPYFRATPIFYAVSGDHKEIVDLLISRGADINSYDERLLKFAMWKSHNSLKSLLENGIDPGKFKLEDPPEDQELVELLVSYGAKFEINDYHVNWPRLVYVSRGDKGEHPEAVQRLLDLGADVNIRNYKGKTALHFAAKAGFARVMDVLMKNGADVNAPDNNGETPLFDAVRSIIKNASKKIAAVQFLLSHGADPNFENERYVTPIEVAQKARRIESEEISEMLQQASKNQDAERIAVEKFDDIIKSIEELAQKELSNWPEEWTGFNWPGYTYEHTLRVRNLSLTMARQMEADEQIVELAALLHDIGRPEGEPHSETGARRTEEVLSELEIETPIRQRVCHIIQTHLEKSPEYPIENLILYDADLIDANYGYAAFTRYFTIRANRSHSVEEMIDKAPELMSAFEAKLGNVFTDIGDTISRERFGRMQEFLDSLMDENHIAVSIVRYLVADAHRPSLLRQVEQMESILNGGSATNGLESSAFLGEFVEILKEEIAGER